MTMRNEKREVPPFVYDPAEDIREITDKEMSTFEDVYLRAARTRKTGEIALNVPTRVSAALKSDGRWFSLTVESVSKDEDGYLVLNGKNRTGGVARQVSEKAAGLDFQPGHLTRISKALVCYTDSLYELSEEQLAAVKKFEDALDGLYSAGVAAVYCEWSDKFGFANGKLLDGFVYEPAPDAFPVSLKRLAGSGLMAHVSVSGHGQGVYARMSPEANKEKRALPDDPETPAGD